MSLSVEDLPHEHTHFALFEAECGHAVEIRGSKPIEPKYLLPMTQDDCPWCQAKEHDIELPDEIQSKFRGGATIRRSPITVAEYTEWAAIEEEVEKDGPALIDPRRPAKNPEGEAGGATG